MIATICRVVRTRDRVDQKREEEGHTATCVNLGLPFSNIFNSSELRGYNFAQERLVFVQLVHRGEQDM